MIGQRVFDALHEMDADQLATVARMAIEQIHPDPESDGMHWRTYGELIRRQLDRIEFEGDARDEIREFIDATEAAEGGGSR